MPRFDISESAEFGKWLREGMLGAARRATFAAALHGVSALQNEIIPGEKPPPIDTRAYVAAWRAEPTEVGADLYNTIPYAPIIDGGARAKNIKISKEMIAALTEWVKRKGIVKPKSQSAEALRDAEVEARQAAWAIAVSMKTKGIFNRDGQAGLQITKKVVQRVKGYFKEEFIREVRRQFGG